MSCQLAATGKKPALGLIVLQWNEQIALHTGQLTYSHHGHCHQQRAQTLDLALEDKVRFVLTTYGTLASEMKAEAPGLFAVEWHRVLLDEAHLFRNQETLYFEAVEKLKVNPALGLTVCRQRDSGVSLGLLSTTAPWTALPTANCWVISLLQAPPSGRVATKAAVT